MKIYRNHGAIGGDFCSECLKMIFMLILIFLVKRKTVIYLGLVVLRLGKIALDWYVIQEEHLLYKNY